MTVIRKGRRQLNTETAVEFDSGSTGSLGHYTMQGNRQGYVCKHQDGAYSVAVTGSGYYPCRGGGCSWESYGERMHTVDDPSCLPVDAQEALVDSGILSVIK